MALDNKLIYIVTGLSLVIWLVFKYFYPYPNIGIDSYFYIQAAASNVEAGTWPIGYSKFMRLVAFFSHSHYLLVTVQYFILQLSFLLFYITIHLFYKLSKAASIILFVFFFLNPLLLFASNHIMSDVLFAGLTFIWISQLLWIIYRPKPYMIFTHALLIVIIFTIRYTALYYPIIATLVFIFSRLAIKWKLTGIALTFIGIACFVYYTSNKMEEVSGVRQFSSTGGWKLASNALYMYEHVAQDDKAVVPEKFKVIHGIVQRYFKGPHTLVDLLRAPDEPTTGSYYSFAYESPLMEYLRVKKGKNVDIFDFKNTAPLGPYYNEYAKYLIKNHPAAYLNHVIYPDLITYIIPFPEIYGYEYSSYYLWGGKFGDTAKDWFRLNQLMIPKRNIDIRGAILSPWPVILAMINILFILTIPAFFILQLYKKISSIQLYGILLILIYCLLNAAYMISIAAMVLRFQLVILVFEFLFIVLIVDLILKEPSKVVTPRTD